MHVWHLQELTTSSSTEFFVERTITSLSSKQTNLLPHLVTNSLHFQLDCSYRLFETVANICDHLHCTEKYLDKGIDAYHDVLCGSE